MIIMTEGKGGCVPLRLQHSRYLDAKWCDHEQDKIFYLIVSEADCNHAHGSSVDDESISILIFFFSHIFGV